MLSQDGWNVPYTDLLPYWEDMLKGPQQGK
jgi:hypothetical protein